MILEPLLILAQDVRDPQELRLSHRRYASRESATNVGRPRRANRTPAPASIDDGGTMRDTAVLEELLTGREVAELLH